MPETDNPRGAAGAPDLAGFLILDKPEPLSSMQAIAVVRRRAGRARTGHAGTLDPLATGILVVALGRPATRLIDRFMNTTKRYRTIVDLSAFTETDDREGERQVIEVESPPTRERVEEALSRFEGTIQQRPPAFSAIKIDGKRAYARARRGEDVRPEPRAVTIHRIKLLEYAWPAAEIEMLTAKGVYVRSVARDLGLALGTGGYCRTLRRTAVGPFDEAMATSLDDVPEPIEQADLIGDRGGVGDDRARGIRRLIATLGPSTAPAGCGRADASGSS